MEFLIGIKIWARLLFWPLVVMLIIILFLSLVGCQDTKSWRNNIYVDTCLPLYTKANTRQDSLIVDSAIPVTIGYASRTTAYSCLALKENR